MQETANNARGGLRRFKTEAAAQKIADALNMGGDRAKD